MMLASCGWTSFGNLVSFAMSKLFIFHSSLDDAFVRELR